MSTLTGTLREFGQIKLMAMLGTAVVLIGFFIFIALRVSSPTLSPLYTNMSIEDGGAIVSELERMGVDYELRGDGTQIMVPSNDVARLRLQMAEQGLPGNGSIVGNELFDSSESLGTSTFVLNVNKVRALEGELARTISSFQKVDDARVHLVLPKRELFSRDRQNPTASVALKLRTSNLGKEEIAAIRHLVATAVPGLDVQKITIVDQRGRLLAKGGQSEGDAHVLAEESESFRVNFENRMQERLRSLIEQSVGIGKVRITVNADIDFDRIVTNAEEYDPEGQVQRSVQAIEENEVSNEKDINNTVTVGNNLPDAAGGQDGSESQTQLTRTEETTNFEISKKVINHVKETGTVKRLSVAVLVDGVYNTVGEGDEATKEYSARSAEELASIQSLVEAAVGYDAARGDEINVINMAFAEPEDLFKEDSLGWMNNEMNGIIQTLVLGGVAILALMLVIRPLVSRAVESNVGSVFDEEFEREALLAPTNSAGQLALQSSAFLEDDGEGEELIEHAKFEGQVKSSSIKKLNTLVSEHPDETLSIIREWMFN